MNRIALIAVAMLTIAAAAFLSARHRREPAGPHGRASIVARRGRAVLLPAPRQARTRQSPRSSSRVVVERFLRAFDRYQRGHVDEQELRATTTAEFASELLAQPPRLPLAGHAVAMRAVSLTAVRRGGAVGGWDVRLRDGRRVSLITVTVLREQGRWRVAGLR